MNKNIKITVSLFAILILAVVICYFLTSFPKVTNKTYVEYIRFQVSDNPDGDSPWEEVPMRINHLDRLKIVLTAYKQSFYEKDGKVFILKELFDNKNRLVSYSNDADSTWFFENVIRMENLDPMLKEGLMPEKDEPRTQIIKEMLERRSDTIKPEMRKSMEKAIKDAETVSK